MRHIDVIYAELREEQKKLDMIPLWDREALLRQSQRVDELIVEYQRALLETQSRELHKAEWEVRPVSLDEARVVVENHHYARGAANTAVATHGLFRRNEWFGARCYGVAWWIPPTREAGGAVWCNPDEVLALSRLVLVPEAPRNAATFLLMRSVRMLDQRWRCLLTYADTWRGHTGHIYRAAGWEYLGLTQPKAIFTVDGRLTAIKAGPRTRTHAEMHAMGAKLVGRFPKHRFRYVRAG
ncbi:MAG: aspartyl-phosphate phosphatase Spo0E family protein [Firmicutes bacterium]|nr:aspartyl-phosphate phosphatase Spo0E family protein [Bacillota bacterium]